MNFRFPARWRHALAAGLVSLPVAGLAAEPGGTQTIEILHGARKIWPVPAPMTLSQFPSLPPIAPAPVPVASPKSATAVEPDPAESAPRSGESRTIILTGYAYPQQGFAPSNAPWLFPTPPVANQPAATTASSQPTVVVIREPSSESHAAMVPEPVRGITIGNETLLGICIGAIGLGFGFVGWNRRRTTPPVVPAPLVLPPAPPSNGVMLLGEFNAGPLPTTAEKFDLGPSYETERQEKKKVETQNQAAVLEFILAQNLALQADLAGPDAQLPEAVEIDPDLPGDTLRLDIA